MPRHTTSKVVLLALAPSVLLAAAPAVSATVGSVASAQAATTTTVFASDLTPSSSKNGWGPAEKDRSNGELPAGDGRTLRVGGTAFAKGIGVHAASDLRYTVPGRCTTFSSVVGVDDEVGSEGSVVFEVFQGTTRLYSSGVLKGSSPNGKVSVSVTPGAILRLVVGDGGNGVGKDHADWADAKFTCTTEPTVAPTPPPSSTPTPAPSAPAALTYVSDLPAVSSTNGYGLVEKDRSNGEAATGDGQPITLNGVRFSKGLGVHSASDVRVLVPAGCTRFDATVGVDDETGVEGSVVFSVLDGTTKVYDSGRMTNASPNGTVAVPVTPGNVLGLVVGDAGDGVGKDHADWADARFACATSTAATPAPTTPAPTTPALAPTTPPTTPTTPPATGTTGTGPAPASPVGMTGTWSDLFVDEFSGTALDSNRWNDHEPWENGGYQTSDAWYPVPATTNQLQVADGALTLKARRAAGLPNNVKWTTSAINSRGKFSIPAGVTSYTEARLKAPSGNALLPAFWLLGNGTSGTGEGWPINGEIDILEFANNNVGERNSPFASLWYPKDVYTNAPGTWLNATHVSNVDSYVKRPDLLNSYHTWGLYRSPSKMEIYIDGVKLATWLPNVAYNGNIPLPPMLFTKDQHIRFSLGVGGGWAGAGFTESQYQEGDLSVDYVKVWRQP